MATIITMKNDAFTMAFDCLTSAILVAIEGVGELLTTDNKLIVTTTLSCIYAASQAKVPFPIFNFNLVKL